MKKSFKAITAVAKSILIDLSVKGEAYKTIMSVILSAFIVVVLMNCVFINAYIPTGSMEPTIQSGDRVFGVRFIHNYKRGDIIVFKDPDGSLLKNYCYSKRKQSPLKTGGLQHSSGITKYHYRRKSGIDFLSCGNVALVGLFLENHFSFHSSIERSTICCEIST